MGIVSSFASSYRNFPRETQKGQRITQKFYFY